MGFLRNSLRVLQDVTSIGGTYRLRASKERYRILKETYDQICSQISNCNAALLAAISTVRYQVQISTRRLNAACRMLNPLDKRAECQIGHGSSCKEYSLVQCATPAGINRGQPVGMSEHVPLLAGGGTGAASAAASWGAVQVAAHASTGTAMAGLHGAAAANAGWAWFGGGSLAAGGGGIAAGHFVLPGIGTAIAVAVSATLSHREANKLGKFCEELEGANGKNSIALAEVQTHLDSVNRLQDKLRREGRLLNEALQAARSKVRRFGWFSHLWRLLRFWIKGYYYTTEEFIFVQRLDDTVMRFISTFRTM